MEYVPAFPHTGWICPKCGRTYSSTTPSCFFCGGENEVAVTSKTEEKTPSLFDIFNPNLFGNHNFLNQNPLMEDPTPKTREE